MNVYVIKLYLMWQKAKTTNSVLYDHEIKKRFKHDTCIFVFLFLQPSDHICFIFMSVVQHYLMLRKQPFLNNFSLAWQPLSLFFFIITPLNVIRVLNHRNKQKLKYYNQNGFKFLNIVLGIRIS